MTPLRLIGLIAATVTLTTLGMNVLADTAKRSDIVEAISTHSERPHPATDERVKALEVSNGVQASKLAKLEDVPEDVGAIKARIDLLIYEAQNTPRRERSTRAAARRVRREARERGEDDDPLAGMEGL
jgi:hypothetical protein